MSEILNIVENIRAGKSTARAEVEKSLTTFRETEDLHALLEIFPDEALKRADEIDEKIAKIRKNSKTFAAEFAKLGKLVGVPYVAKDNFLTEVGHTTAASEMLANFESPLDATAIERLNNEGAILIGKANLDAFAHGGSTENSAFGATKNAVDAGKVAGGSSGGSAVAVAKNIVPFALGSDTGGSIRQPASFNGVVGLKPTYGMISRYGVVAMASSTDVVGPLTRTVADAELLCEILAGPDGRDGTVQANYFDVISDHESEIISESTHNYKLYLGSYKPWETGEDFAKCVEMIGKDKTALLITNAWDTYDWNERSETTLREMIDFLASFGVKSEQLDLRNFFGKSAELAKKLDKVGLIYAFGGNTFILRRAYSQSGFDKLLPKLLEQNVVYGGFSAGSCICAETLRGLETVDDPNIVPEKYDKKIIWEGLGLVDFVIAPHYRSDHPESLMVENEVAHYRENGIACQTLRDGEALVVNNGKVVKVLKKARHNSKKKLKIGLIKEFMGEGIDEDVRARTLEFVEQLKQNDHEITEVSLPMSKYALAMYYIVVPAELSSNLARFDGIRYGLRAGARQVKISAQKNRFATENSHILQTENDKSEAKTLDEVYENSRNLGFMPENKRRLMIGAFVLSSGYFDAYYLKAQQARTLLIREFDALFADYDFLIGPVAPTSAFSLGENTADPLKMYLADVMTTPASLAGLPAISLPNGESKDSLPIGVQIIAPMKKDAELLDFAKSVEHIK
jgi:Asp-tRNA(Asn)/Glu-tRNA(Gln) amidotransferase A subunit family amidase